MPPGQKFDDASEYHGYHTGHGKKRSAGGQHCTTTLLSILDGMAQGCLTACTHGGADDGRGGCVLKQL